jgi:hypothetical protein
MGNTEPVTEVRVEKVPSGWSSFGSAISYLTDYPSDVVDTYEYGVRLKFSSEGNIAAFDFSVGARARAAVALLIRSAGRGVKRGTGAIAAWWAQVLMNSITTYLVMLGFASVVCDFCLAWVFGMRRRARAHRGPQPPLPPRHRCGRVRGHDDGGPGWAPRGRAARSTRTPSTTCSTRLVPWPAPSHSGAQ